MSQNKHTHRRWKQHKCISILPLPCRAIHATQVALSGSESACGCLRVVMSCRSADVIPRVSQLVLTCAERKRAGPARPGFASRGNPAKIPAISPRPSPVTWHRGTGSPPRTCGFVHVCMMGCAPVRPTTPRKTKHGPGGWAAPFTLPSCHCLRRFDSDSAHRDRQHARGHGPETLQLRPGPGAILHEFEIENLKSAGELQSSRGKASTRLLPARIGMGSSPGAAREQPAPLRSPVHRRTCYACQPRTTAMIIDTCATHGHTPANIAVRDVI